MYSCTLHTGLAQRVGKGIAVLYRVVWPEGGYRNSCTVQAGVAQRVGRNIAVICRPLWPRGL